MHIVVCIKQVPDSAQIRVHPVTNTIMRQGVPTIINPYDLFALEAALRLRDLHGGKVTVLTMGPPMAEESLRKALSFGPTAPCCLTDRFFAGSDTLATSYALSQTIRKIGESSAPSMCLHGQTDHRRRYGAGRPRHRQAARTSISSPMSRDPGAEPRSGLHHRGAPGRGRRASALHQAAVPHHHAGGYKRNRRGSIEMALRGARGNRHLERRRGRHHRYRQMRLEGLAYRGEARVRA